jgi:hypothetical protein
MWFLTLLLACKLGAAPKDTDNTPDTDGGKAAAAVAEEAKVASEQVGAMLDQVKAAEGVSPVEAAPAAPVVAPVAPVAPPPAPPKP